MDSLDLSNQLKMEQGQHEAEVSFGGEVDLHKHLQTCQKNPGHLNFLPVDDFKDRMLLFGGSCIEVSNLVEAISDLTVRVSVKYVSENRPETYPGSDQPFPCYKNKGSNFMRTGTGIVWRLDEYLYTDNTSYSCICKECRKGYSPKKRFARIYINTAAHVVFDLSEGAHTTCHLFFDRANTPKACPGVVTLNGMYDVNSDIKQDWCKMMYVTHDLTLIERIKGMKQRFNNCNILMRPVKSLISTEEYSFHSLVRPLKPRLSFKAFYYYYDCVVRHAESPISTRKYHNIEKSGIRPKGTYYHTLVRPVESRISFKEYYYKCLGLTEEYFYHREDFVKSLIIDSGYLYNNDFSFSRGERYSEMLLSKTFDMNSPSTEIMCQIKLARNTAVVKDIDGKEQCTLLQCSGVDIISLEIWKKRCVVLLHAWQIIVRRLLHVAAFDTLFFKKEKENMQKELKKISTQINNFLRRAGFGVQNLLQQIDIEKMLQEYISENDIENFLSQAETDIEEIFITIGGDDDIPSPPIPKADTERLTLKSVLKAFQILDLGLSEEEYFPFKKKSGFPRIYIDMLYDMLSLLRFAASEKLILLEYQQETDFFSRPLKEKKVHQNMKLSLLVCSKTMAFLLKWSRKIPAILVEEPDLGISSFSNGELLSVVGPKETTAIIVSHPHGCSKQISVGHVTAIDETENLGRQYTYTTPTCPGSSGAYVFVIGRERDEWLGFDLMHSGNGEGNKKGNYSIPVLY